jgi:predicted lactoylglutathione lyase
MTSEIWINLPVKDVNKSIAFFMQIGFKMNLDHGSSNESASFVVGKKGVVVMLFDEATFSRFAGKPVSDVNRGTEVLFSIDAESREEVDEIAKKVVQAGGAIYGGPTENHGWLYGCGFTDIDGHRWNLMYMDLEKMSMG